MTCNCWLNISAVLIIFLIKYFVWLMMRNHKNDLYDETYEIDFVQFLPMELVEEILLYLNPKELAAASEVSSVWRDAINSNKLWGRLCNKNGWKDDFEASDSQFCRSHKQFRKWSHTYDSFPPICKKRLLFNKHSRLLNNWRCGNFAVHKIVSETSGKNYLKVFEPVSCDGRHLVMAEYSKVDHSSNLAVWSLSGVPFRLCELSLPTSIKPIDALAIDHGFIVFIQNWIVFVYKLCDVTGKFELAYTINDLKPLENVGRFLYNMKRMTPFFKITKESIIYVPSQSHSSVDFIPIFFWDTKSGKVKAKLNFDSMYYQITSAEWLGESCYLAVLNRKIKSYQVIEFGLKTANWEYFSHSVHYPIEQIVGNDKYILAVTRVVNSNEDQLFFIQRNERKELVLWDRVTGSFIKKFNVSGKGFQFVDNYIMYFDSSLLTVVNPKDPSNIKSEIAVKSPITSIKACQNPSVLVVIKTGCYVEVWDWGLGTRLYTASSESGFGSKVWCDNRRIITYYSDREEGGVMTLAFW